MIMIKRLLKDKLSLNNKSILLLGPRQVGKSTLIRSLKPDLSINFSEQDVFLEYATNPKKLKDVLDQHKPKTVFIDEIQRLPSLLNTIQALVDNNKSLKFYLTGSSARKLKKGRANLLPGRVLSYQLGPLVASELDYKLDTRKALEYGTLPEIYLRKNLLDAKKILKSYTTSYLKEEIQAEALTRNFEAFLRFFAIINESVGQFIDYSKLAKKTKISRHSCSRYFEVLEDTLIGYKLLPFASCIDTASLIKHPKFYLFDTGVYNSLLSNFNFSVDRAGTLYEQLIFSQVMHSCSARDIDFKASTFRTRGGLEIDFIFEVGNNVFPIEVKSSQQLISSDVQSLKQFKKYYSKKHSCYLFYSGHEDIKMDGIWCLPWQRGLKEIGL